MTDWESVFNSYNNSGIFDTANASPGDAVEKAAVKCGLDFLHIDCHDAADKNELLATIAETLSFPDYFGMNWDALYDCLTDMAWNPAAGYVLLLSATEYFEKNHPEEMSTCREIIHAVSLYWKQRKISFFTVISAK